MTEVVYVPKAMMIDLPYQDGCKYCDQVKAWRRAVDKAVQEATENHPDFMIGITWNAEDVPTCPIHLTCDDTEDEFTN